MCRLYTTNGLAAVIKNSMKNGFTASIYSIEPLLRNSYIKYTIEAVLRNAMGINYNVFNELIGSIRLYRQGFLNLTFGETCSVTKPGVVKLVMKLQINQ